MSFSAQARANMIEGQLRPNKITDPRLLAAVEGLAREQFVPDSAVALAYADGPVDLGGGRFMLAPMLLARLIQEAQCQTADVVLVVGAGTGYGAALFSRLAATVVAVEENLSLSCVATANLQKAGADNAAVINAPLTQGHVKGAPYNVILIEGAVSAAPEALLEQLAEGGRLVTVEQAPGQPAQAKLWLKQGGNTSSRVLFDASAAYLPRFAPQPAFLF